MSSSEKAVSCDTAGFLGLEAPRYTSYPSAHHFSTQVDEAIHHQWLADIADNATLSAYVHIPFCKELCWFCGCHTKMTKRYEPIAKYVRVLLKEIEIIGQKRVHLKLDLDYALQILTNPDCIAATIITR